LRVPLPGALDQPRARLVLDQIPQPRKSFSPPSNGQFGGDGVIAGQRFPVHHGLSCR